MPYEREEAPQCTQRVKSGLDRQTKGSLTKKATPPTRAPCGEGLTGTRYPDFIFTTLTLIKISGFRVVTKYI